MTLQLLSKLEIDELNSIKEIIDLIIEKRNISKIKYISVDKIGLSVRCKNALKCHGIFYLHEVTEYSRLTIRKVHNLGHRSVLELDDKLPEYGLSWKI